ncbi:hypothetical protein BGW38_007826 [Lunasporangiospora selenospora]|uniref:Uncharacterized protein n=1 Tax=Lunasporangiospora selenospora TaxID=979761 RepID=A0A9P6K9Y2_9FUNG|nr:hypothetical protein BGW38_007826 [Lunasporangiospora selenospora]
MGEDHVLVPVLLDAVNAFRNSIEAIKGTTFVPHTPFETQPYHSDNSGQRLRWTWTLPRLQELELEGEVAVAFDLSTLQHCPKLRSLRLVLPTYLFSTCEDEDTLARMSEEVEHICKASQLVELELYGKWPLSDYLLLMIAERMRKLRKLLIVGARDVSPRGFQEAVAKIPTLEVLVIGQNLIPRANRQVRFQEMKTHNPRLTITVEED